MDNILPGIIIDGVLGNLIAIPVFKSQYVTPRSTTRFKVGFVN